MWYDLFMRRSFYKGLFVFLVAFFLIFLFWKNEKKEIIPKYSDDIVLFKKGLNGDSYQIDLATRVLEPYKNNFEEITKFYGFPIEETTNKIKSFVQRIFCVRIS